jgi:hypothetical protein
VISNLDVDKRRKKKEKKFGNSKPWHLPKEMAKAKKKKKFPLTPMESSLPCLHSLNNGNLVPCSACKLLGPILKM